MSWYFTAIRRAKRWPVPLAAGLATLAATAFRPAADGDNALLKRLVQSVQAFYRAAQPESAYLHLDKSLYAAGETIWFKAYVVDAQQHRPDSISHVLHVELVSDRQQVVLRQALHLAGGLAPGSLALPDTLAPGTYLLRAYTSWMRNSGPDFFYSRRVQVWPAAPDSVAETSDGRSSRLRAVRKAAARLAAPPDVQFFPEGGNLVEGIENTVAFKVTDYTGHGLEAVGQVLDAHNQPVVAFKSLRLGMGAFRLTPQPGQRYHAVLTPATAEARSVPLPAAQASGHVLHVATGSSSFIVSVRQHGGPGGAVLLLGQVRGQVLYVGQGQEVGDEPFMTRIPKSKFPGGIVQFTLFDAQGTPLAERLAFAQEVAPLRVALTPDRPSYGPRQPVRLRVAVTDAASLPVATHLSVAVTEAGSTDDAAETMASRLLLTADLAGYVESPGSYFQDNSPETTDALDHLMLTQGWRRFAWPAVLAGQAPTREFGAEQSLGILGQITRLGGKPAPESQVMLLQSKPTYSYLASKANSEGYFLFNGLGGCDSMAFTVQARTARGGSNLLLHLDAGPPLPPAALPGLPHQPTPATATAVHQAQAQLAAARRFRLDTAKTVLLGAVKVTAKKAVAPPDGRRLYNASNATVLKMASIPAAQSGFTVFQLLQGRVAGVSVIGAEPNMRVIIRGGGTITGSSSPLFLLDGIPVSQEALSFFLAADVESIEVLKGPEAAIYGSRGAGGVISVLTRRGSPNYKPSSEAAPGVAVVQLPGYACPRTFYVPRYDRPAAPAPPDPRRSTLYWNPTVRTDATGQAELTFYTSGAVGAFQVTLEGLSATGQPVLGRSRLQVRLAPE